MVSNLLVPPMGKKISTPADEGTPNSETARIATDLMEMLRELCFHSRDARGKRIKIAQLIDNLLRPAVVKEHGAMLKRQATKPDADE